MKTPTYLRLHESLELLRFLIPPTGLMHVGIGQGNDAKRYVDWNLSEVVLFDADKSSIDRVAAAYSSLGWQALNKYVSNVMTDKDFYIASNASENGSINPDQLKVFWKNISTREIRKITSTTIDAELPTLNVSQSINWLVVDCLPALPVLSGANGLLEQCDVLIVRLLLDNSRLKLPGTGREEIEASLAARGFRLLGFEEELQPDIAQALFVRDWKRVSEARIVALSSENQAALAKQEALSSSWQTKYQEQLKLADERLVLADGLIKVRDDLARQSLEGAEQSKKLMAECAAAQMKIVEQEKLVQDMQSKHQELENLANERQKSVDILVTRRDELAVRIKQDEENIKKLMADRDIDQTKIIEQEKLILDLQGKHQEQAKLAGERQVAIDSLIVRRDALINQASQNVESSKKLNADHETAQLKIAELQKQILDLQGKHLEQVKLVDERQNQIEHLQKVSEHQSKLAIERDAQIVPMQKALQEQMTQVADLQKMVDDLKRVRDSHMKTSAERLSQIEQLQNDNAIQINQTATFQQRCEQAASDIAELKRDLTEGRQTMAINTRLLALREADLRDLQCKYQASVSIQESQHQMLVKLGERLSAASRYFHQLADQQIKIPAGGHGLSIGGNPGKSKILAKPKSAIISKVAVRPPAKLKSDSGKKTRIPAKNKSKTVKKTSVKKTSVKKTSKQRSGGY